MIYFFIEYFNNFPKDKPQISPPTDCVITVLVDVERKRYLSRKWLGL